MKLIIIGGHLAPALAVIESLPKDTEILFIGRKHTFEGDTGLSLEYQKITSMHIPFKSLNTGRLQRKLTKYTIPSLIKLPQGFVQASKIIREFQPDAIIGFGGYLQIPVCLAAYLRKIPILLHEQTLNAGLANKIVARFASKVCISWEESKQYFPKQKTILTGNPLRQEFFTTVKHSLKEKKPSNIPTIYITGGSAGSHAINLLIEGCLPKLLEQCNVIHQTGDSHEFKDFDRLQNLKQTLSQKLASRYTLTKFVEPEKVAQIVIKADMIVSRSGMNTTCEILYLGKPCLLIPLPYGQTNEQLSNARLIEKIGLGEIAQQKDLTAERFYSQIMQILAKLEMYENNSEKAKKLIHEDAAQKIVQTILNEIRQKDAPKRAA
jgi:UDP-N-acetylglucosamine--N-acetylmuramyl-(pentapeptide) pyrophosphoryl-undecaprenol N-acetylglucosamine transferase